MEPKLELEKPTPIRFKTADDLIKFIKEHFPYSHVKDAGWAKLRDLVALPRSQPQEAGRNKLRDRMKYMEPEGIGTVVVVDIEKEYATSEFTRHIILPPPKRFGILNDNMVFPVVQLRASTPQECMKILDVLDSATDYLEDYQSKESRYALCDVPPELQEPPIEKKVEGQEKEPEQEQRWEAEPEAAQPAEPPKPNRIVAAKPVVPQVVEEALSDPQFKALAAEVLGKEPDPLGYLVLLGTPGVKLAEMYKSGKLAVQAPPRLPEDVPPELEEAWTREKFRELAAVFGASAPRELMAKAGDRAVELARWFLRHEREAPKADCPKTECPKVECPQPDVVDALLSYFGISATDKAKKRVDRLLAALEPVLIRIDEIPEEAFARIVNVFSKLA